MNSTNVEVIVDNLENNPHCFHGPSLLFKRFRGKTKEYYACSACRDHKDCNFYLPASDLVNRDDSHWRNKQRAILLKINKSKPYKKYLQILKSLKKQNTSSNTGCENGSKFKTNESTDDRTSKEVQASYCYTCHQLFDQFNSEHNQCKVKPNLTLYELTHPTEILIPKVDAKTHAQFFFSKTSVKDILLLLTKLKVSKILCIGTPRIHEHILNNYKNKLESLLLDLDSNYYNFYSKNQFIWYNMFNNYIFNHKQKSVLLKFLQSSDTVVLMDPPFGGRVEPLAYTLSALSKTFVDVNKCDSEKSNLRLKIFWFFPYFMEQHIVRSLPNFRMFDYKVNYENHSSFTNTGNRKRKFGSPVRIFTNVPLSQLDLKHASGYKYCKPCGYWVSEENKHCTQCNSCTSKDGRTYVHCFECRKCVKPSYEHCDTCSRCCLPTHICGEFQPDPNCYHCNQPGHKRNNCPYLADKKTKRSVSEESGSKKKLKTVKN